MMALLVLPLIGRADEAEADQAATAEMAVAVDLDSLDAPPGVLRVARADEDLRGDSKEERLSQVDRRALHTYIETERERIKKRAKREGQTEREDKDRQRDKDREKERERTRERKRDVGMTCHMRLAAMF